LAARRHWVIIRLAAKALRRRRPVNSNYKGFPKTRKRFSIFSSSPFPDHVSLPLRGSMKKMADCETTTGHVGQDARTLMKDARRGLNR